MKKLKFSVDVRRSYRGFKIGQENPLLLVLLLCIWINQCTWAVPQFGMIFQTKDLISCRNGFGKFGISTLAYGVSGP